MFAILTDYALCASPRVFLLRGCKTAWLTIEEKYKKKKPSSKRSINTLRGVSSDTNNIATNEQWEAKSRDKKNR